MLLPHFWQPVHFLHLVDALCCQRTSDEVLLQQGMRASHKEQLLTTKSGIGGMVWQKILYFLLLTDTILEQWRRTKL
nr:MAG TPA: hypothetical protein [Caudoviricetes sp.]